MATTISNFVPENTTYFYGYPAGEDSRFFNLVPPSIEELVSARPLVCAGNSVNIVTFQNSARKEILNLLEDIGVRLISNDRVMRLDEAVGANIVGAERNERIIDSLQQVVPARSLIMAQPYVRPELQTIYQMNPSIGLELNDKKNMHDYIPSRYLPRVLASYSAGSEFASEKRVFAPCVIKVGSSSSGDGVRVCFTENDFEEAQKLFADVHGNILVQEFIAAPQNIGVQFGIPYDREKPIEVLGLSRQITSSKGEFMGGIVLKNDEVPEGVRRVLLDEILPKVRERGWYGVGGLDVLLTEKQEMFFIDPNFRITAMSAYVYQMIDGIVGRNMLTMTARFKGKEQDFKRLADAANQDRLLNVIAARKDESGLQFNGALLFDDKLTLAENAERATAAGVESSILSAILSGKEDIIIPDIR